MISQITSEPDFAILPQGILGNPQKPLFLKILGQKLSSAPWGEIAKSGSEIICEIMLAFI